jgi:ribosomal protein L37AE/L43A
MATTLFLLLGVAGIAAGGYALLKVRPAGEAAYLLFRCGACAQKLRYPKAKAGRTWECPRCKTAWTLPATAQKLPSTLKRQKYRIQRLVPQQPAHA